MRPQDLAHLETLGLFRHVRAEDLDRVRRETLESQFPFADETHRAYFADAENLAEHGVRDFLGEVAPFLRKEGVPIEVVYREVKYPATKTRPAGRGVARLDDDGWIDPDGPGAYVQTLRIAFSPGGELCDVREDDWGTGDYSLFVGEREIVIYVEGDAGWTEATVATIAILNELLAAHGSAERAWALYGSNDLRIAFATPEMARTINAAVIPRERLYDGLNAPA